LIFLAAPKSHDITRAPLKRIYIGPFIVFYRTDVTVLPKKTAYASLQRERERERERAHRQIDSSRGKRGVEEEGGHINERRAVCFCCSLFIPITPLLDTPGANDAVFMTNELLVQKK